MKQSLDICFKERDFARWSSVNREQMKIVGDRESTMANFQGVLSLFKVVDPSVFPEAELQFLVATAYSMLLVCVDDI